ncbi:MAG: hypothetical protein CME26_16160 [Gemmatimonadetes bacterium]|nr:hypothetical protein [Gemmatimonadota bacterium]
MRSITKARRENPFARTALSRRVTTDTSTALSVTVLSQFKVLELPMKITYIGSALLAPFPWVLVKVRTDTGLVGIGEADNGRASTRSSWINA